MKRQATLFLISLALCAFSIHELSRWAVVIIFASLTYGALSPLISARRLYFLSAASVHTALLAVVLAIPLAKLTGLNEYGFAVAIGLALTYCVGYAIYKGMNSDVATAVFVSLTASLSVLAMYFVLTKFSIGTDLWAIILGDPLLASREDVYYAASVAVLTVVAIALTYREQVCIGIERDCAVLSGINVKLYDWILYTLLGIATIAMIKIVGFVLEHVLLFLPSAIAIALARNSKDVLIFSIFVSLIFGLVGLHISVMFNQAPSGVIGLLMFLLYVTVIALKRCIK